MTATNERSSTCGSSVRTGTRLRLGFTTYSICRGLRQADVRPARPRSKSPIWAGLVVPFTGAHPSLHDDLDGPLVAEPPHPINWNLLTADEAEWIELNRWVNWLRRTYGLPTSRSARQARCTDSSHLRRGKHQQATGTACGESDRLLRRVSAGKTPPSVALRCGQHSVRPRSSNYS